MTLLFVGIMFLVTAKVGGKAGKYFVGRQKAIADVNGYIEEFELKSDEENSDADVDMMDEDLVTKIIVTYGRPRFRKIK